MKRGHQASPPAPPGGHARKEHGASFKAGTEARFFETCSCGVTLRSADPETVRRRMEKHLGREIPKSPAEEFRKDLRQLCLVRHYGKLFAGDLPANVYAFIDDAVAAFVRRAG